jgi:transposase-like protein
MAMKKEVLSIEEKVKVIREIENGRKKADVCHEFGLVNSTVQTIWKNMQYFDITHLGNSTVMSR